jgi:hypothetical protein
VGGAACTSRPQPSDQIVRAASDTSTLREETPRPQNAPGFADCGWAIPLLHPRHDSPLTPEGRTAPASGSTQDRVAEAPIPCRSATGTVPAGGRRTGRHTQGSVARRVISRGLAEKPMARLFSESCPARSAAATRDSPSRSTPYPDRRIPGVARSAIESSRLHAGWVSPRGICGMVSDRSRSSHSPFRSAGSVTVADAGSRTWGISCSGRHA